MRIRSDAVRLDLNDDLELAGRRVSPARGSMSSLTSSESDEDSESPRSRGWSKTQSSLVEEERVFGLLSPPLRLLMGMPGVEGLLAEPDDSTSASRDGIDSLESERTEGTGSRFDSLVILETSCSHSLGGLNRTPQDRGLELDDACLKTSESSEIPSSSLGARRECLRRLWAFQRCFDPGNDVIASKAAVEGGIGCGSCGIPASSGIDLILGFGPLHLRCPPFRVRVGITTGLEGEVSGALDILAGFTMPTVVPFLAGLVAAGCPDSGTIAFFSSSFVEDDADGGELYR